MIDESIQRARRWIFESQNHDGGFPFPEIDSMSACWLTAEALVALNACGADRDDPRVVSGLIWLLRHQNSDGGWPALQIGASTTEGTAWGLLNLSQWNVRKEHSERALASLLNLQDASGGWPRAKGHPPTATMTSMAILALESVVGHINPDFEPLANAYQWLHTSRYGDGGWPMSAALISDVAPASLLLFATRKTRNSLGMTLARSALNWINSSGLPEGHWHQGERWFGYETFDERASEWPRRKYFSLPYALFGSFYHDSPIRGSADLLRLLLNCQSQSGRWIVPTETGESMYPWYTYVTAYLLGEAVQDIRASLPPVTLKQEGGVVSPLNLDTQRL